ncbi:MAG TPA: O-methyltransferase, partial [Gemmatimonadaceae bacterium]|nr:O-methyltransferase [Gemmatimonadaceae bacterium]
AALNGSTEAGLPAISVTPPQGKMLMLLAQLQGAKRILEIGTLGGYSTIWMARALPHDGRLVTLEIDPRHADVARANMTRARLSEKVDIRVGAALDLLPQLAKENSAPFDMTFIDADKANMPGYFEWAVKLSRKGAQIICDNVVRDGAVIDEDSTDASVLGVRRLNEMIAADTRVTATTIQTVGSKGYDGFTMAIVRGEP